MSSSGRMTAGGQRATSKHRTHWPRQMARGVLRLCHSGLFDARQSEKRRLLLTNFPDTETRACRVLLVDDERVVRDLLYYVLEAAGYEVLEASSGPSALAIFKQSSQPIELLVTDYNMPQMSGLELARECSGIRADLPVLYVSGSQPDEELQQDLASCRRDFLAKPFPGNLLITKARQLLAQSAVPCFHAI